MTVDEVLQGILIGQKRAIARGLTWIDQARPEGPVLLRQLFSHSGKAHVVGVTGAPGVGKSTLVNALTRKLRASGKRVAILAVDPSSPFSGGAILGDRIRMQESVMDDGVFMRSLASRGHLGGLSRTTFGALTLLDAAGFDTILIETVGAGQSEVEIMQLAHSTVVVLAPGLGDDIQAIKAGILEIGQVFVVNKADRDGADQSIRALRGMQMLTEQQAWHPPVLATIAETNHGMAELVDAISHHHDFLLQQGIWESFRSIQSEHVIRQAADDIWQTVFRRAHEQPALWRERLKMVQSGQTLPETVVLELLQMVLNERE